jgi:sulfur carrier protein
MPSASGRACRSQRPMVASRRFTSFAPMDVRLEPQGKQLTIAGRRRVGELVRSLGLTAGTVMVIRGDELLTDDEMVEDDESIELRAVISGGSR